MITVGLVHPGAMGAFIGSAIAEPCEVVWAGDGRSEATRHRASRFRDVGSVEHLAATVDAVVSVCPPAFATEVAQRVGVAGFTGLYVDANAISPATMRSVAAALPGADVADGAIIGGPSSDSAVLHLSGPGAGQAAALFAPERLQANVLGGDLGAASALKACFATTTKAHTALMLAARAAARAAGVEAELLAEWSRHDDSLAVRNDRAAATINRKAWRFGAEMIEAASFYRDLQMPDGFSAAAAEVFDRLAGLPRTVDLEPGLVLDTLAAPVDPSGAGTVSS